MNLDPNTFLEIQNSESSKFLLDIDHNLSQLGSEEETRNDPIQFPEPTEMVTQEKQVNVIEQIPKKKNGRTVDDVVDEKGGKMDHGLHVRKTGKKV